MGDLAGEGRQEEPTQTACQGTSRWRWLPRTEKQNACSKPEWVSLRLQMVGEGPAIFPLGCGASRARVPHGPERGFFGRDAVGCRHLSWFGSWTQV